MIDKKYIELMNRDLDSLISSEEKRLLQDYLDGNWEAKEYYDELFIATEALKHLEDPIPSENLRKRIINSINFNKYADKPAKIRTGGFIRSLNIKYAFTFAAGLLAGILIYSLVMVTQSKIVPDEISGTIGLSENFVTLENIPLNYSGLTGNITILKRGNEFWIDVNSYSSRPVDFVISYPDQVQFMNLEPAAAGSMNLSTGKDYTKLISSGKQLYSIKFAATSKVVSPLYLKILQSGTTVYETEFSLNN